ncbi:MAG: DUF2970 domain-containing protein [Aliivibrio sp.]|uniref:DUF2970 domain-containing protein n=1 Tax=Aliivibrio sp. TaxID=1872443 RepID=UPI001A4C6B7E|nr:DUF2970 domain-containing protein [Aliivibrio sp.]
MNQSESKSTNTKSPGILSVLQSVIAAMFGVQTDKKRQQDFKAGHFKYYAVAGVMMAALLVFTLISIVNIVLS